MLCVIMFISSLFDYIQSVCMYNYIVPLNKEFYFDL